MIDVHKSAKLRLKMDNRSEASKKWKTTQKANKSQNKLIN